MALLNQVISTLSKGYNFPSIDQEVQDLDVISWLVEIEVMF